MLHRKVVKLLLVSAFTAMWMTGIQLGSTSGPAELNAAPLPENGVIVYQFHRRFRCDACHDLEEAINEALKTHFSKELESGTLVFEVIDLDAEGNERYSETFDFFYNTVIMVDREGGKQARFKNLEEVWDLTEDKDAAMEFIRKHIAEYL